VRPQVLRNEAAPSNNREKNIQRKKKEKQVKSKKKGS